MKLEFDDRRSPYGSGAQSARFWSEAWVHSQAYCPNCGQAPVNKYENNRPVADFHCGSCREEFELKSQKTNFGAKVVDGAFGTMCERLASNSNPNLMLMNYDRTSLSVRNLLVVPKQFFVREVIEKRKPLAQTARRAGWVGCNILLNKIPEAGKVFIVRDGSALPKHEVLSRWQQILFLRNEGVQSRRWLIEVMNCVESIGQAEFELDDVYAYAVRLAAIYPGNHNVRAKIRQQLQVLRDNGYLEFVSRGRYRLIAG